MMMTKIKTLRPTYAFIDLNNYAYNINQAKKISGSEIMAIVKANGYGHGAARLATYAYEKCGVNKFGVATIEEGIALRDSMENGPEIQILGYVDKNFYSEVIERDLTLTIYNDIIAECYHEFLIEHNIVKAEIVIKVDTGMNRLGYDQTLIINNFLINYPRFNVKMVMSHMPSSDSDLEFSKKQIIQFKKYLDNNELNIPVSMFNSSGICNYSNEFDYTRPGIMTYGYVYSEDHIDLKPVMKIYSKVIHIKLLKKGEKVSYNRTFTADRDMIIGVVPIGYADGYPRRFANKAKMKIGKYYCDVIGAICMDMTMVDMTDIPKADYEDEVEILGDNITANKWAEWGETITYEVLCGISDRIPRVYSD